MSAKAKLWRQVDGASMRTSLSAALSDWFKNKIDIVLVLKLKFYYRFVDDTYRRRKKNEPGKLFSKMNFCHLNVNIKNGAYSIKISAH